MGRPPLPIGTYGEIRCYPAGLGKVRAVTLYRDYDGVTRQVERVGKSDAAAKARLKEAIRDRARASAATDITDRTKIGVVAGVWLDELARSGKSIRTKNTYHRTWHCDLANAVSALQVREVTVGLADRVLKAIRDNKGPGSAKHAKVVLGGIMGLAVRHDALATNPVRDVASVVAGGAGRRRDAAALVVAADLPALRAHLAGSADAVRCDLVDVVDMLAAMGCRIGELLALDWARVDLAAGTVAIEGTVIREPGVGLFVQSHTKSRAGMRTIEVPGWAVGVLRRRFADRSSEWVFPSTSDTLRDPDNTRKQLRKAVADTRWVGLHPHAFRHLVATRLDEAGLSAREIADYLGHERISMTQDVYMNRKAVGSRAASALSDLAPQASSQ